MSIGSRALSEQAGITYRQLDTWTRNGLVNAEPLDYSEGPTNGGQGKSRTYDRIEAETILMIARLVKIGFRPTDAAPIARKFMRGETVRMGGFELRVIGE